MLNKKNETGDCWSAASAGSLPWNLSHFSFSFSFSKIAYVA
jgi:hypothetical protein